MQLSSRPEAELLLELGTLSFEESQLIASMLYITKLGAGSVYRAAAYTLLVKLSDLYGDDFAEESYDDVDMHVYTIDDKSQPLELFGPGQFQIEV